MARYFFEKVMSRCGWGVRVAIAPVRAVFFHSPPLPFSFGVKKGTHQIKFGKGYKGGGFKMRSMLRVKSAAVCMRVLQIGCGWW